MKRVRINGDSHKVPAWVAYVAMDADGSWHGFRYKPLALPNGTWAAFRGAKHLITRSMAGWRTTCVPVRLVAQRTVEDHHG